MIVYELILGFDIMTSQMDLNMYELYLGGVECGIRITVLTILLSLSER